MFVIAVYGVLIAVGTGLLFTPPSYDRRFGIWSIHRMNKFFGPAGVFSLLFGAFLVFAAL